jgi:probable HAF family extracellular repeat protein
LGINASGTVVGTSIPKSSLTLHAFAISPPYSAMTDLGTLGGALSAAFAVNNSGLVVGSSSNAGNRATYAFMAQQTASGKPYVMTSLGALGTGTYSQANAVSSSGTIVGQSNLVPNSLAYHAFIYKGTAQGGTGKMVDLNTLIPANSGWVLTSATGIDDNGLITGTGTFNGTSQAFILAPSASYAYVTNATDNTVSIYSVNASTGVLSTVGTAATGSNPTAVATLTTVAGGYVYVTNGTGNTVSEFQITALGGLSPLGTVPTGNGPNAIVVSSGKQYVYVTNGQDGTVSEYAVNANSGKLSQVGAAVQAGNQPDSIAITPSGQYAYVANRADQTVSMYAINSSSGALTPLPGSPLQSLGFSPSEISVSPTGMYALVGSPAYPVQMAELSIGQGGVLSISNGSVSAAYPFAIDPSGAAFYALTEFFALGACFDDPPQPISCFYRSSTNFSTFDVDSSLNITQTSNSLGYSLSSSSSIVTSSPVALVVTSSGQYAYIVAAGQVRMYSISSGALAPLSPSTVPTGNGPSGMAIAALGS